jgi:hypothetical protein
LKTGFKKIKNYLLHGGNEKNKLEVVLTVSRIAELLKRKFHFTDFNIEPK